MNVKFSLGLENVKHVPINKYARDFTFIVDGKQYQTSRILADLLSPIISELHSVDETADTFTIITTKKLRQQEQSSNTNIDYFSDFLNKPIFEEQEIDSTRMNYYSEYFLQLGNFEEYLKLQHKYSDDITADNVIDRLMNTESIFNQTKCRSSIFENLITNLISFASNHFHELDKEKLQKLSKEQIEMILDRSELKIEDEDSLLRFILYLYQKDHKYSPLFEYVYFENVNDDTLETFVDQFNVDDMTIGIWISISYRLIKSRKRNRKSANEQCTSPKMNILTFSPDSNNKFHGILRHLGDEAGGNVHDKRVVEISSSTRVQGDSYNPKNVADYGSNSYFAPCNVKNVDICFDFKEKQIQPTNYSIQSININCCNAYLRNWVVEVSNDKVNWDIVDEHSNDSSLKGIDKMATFNIKQTNLFYRYIRIRQTGNSWWEGSFYSYISYIDFYGKLKLPNTNAPK
ncbi:hypothetical protein M9Y10_000588 [Tritrichomonas musculus]|uniref:F5/8 type C domain-containing protein n=1 Tax=Tritrichomonas musculus TaxID=1915356 RepID=A0ABR2L4L7_9EUKA